MKKNYVLFLLLLAVLLPLTAQIVTPIPTPRPGITGDLTWTRNIRVYAFSGDVVLAVSNATVTASAITSATALTDSNGKCTVKVTAHDTGSVTITVTAANYPVYTNTYPGLPTTGTISIHMNNPITPVLVYMSPAATTVSTGSAFTNEIRVNSGNQKVAAYGINLEWDSVLIYVNTSIGMNGVEAGDQGFLNAASVPSAGELKIAGFDAAGKGPGNNMQLVKIYWKAGTVAGSTDISVTVETMVDLNYNEITSSYRGAGAKITVISGPMGDVNGDGYVTIVDALMVAQYSVGIPVPGFNSSAADVSVNGDVDIIDALRIAQYSVGLITEF